MSESRRLLLGCLSLVALFFGWNADLLLPLPMSLRHSIVHGDFSNQFYPFQHFAAEEWWHGRIPLWNPYMYAGHPFQADPQTAVFYPPGLLIDLLAGHGGLPFVAMEWRAALSYAIAACGTYLFAARITRNHVAGIIAAATFAGSGFLTSYPMQQLPMLEAATWLPWCLYCLERAVEWRPCSLPWCALAGGALGVSFLAGHSQTTMFSGYLAAAYLVVRTRQSGGNWSRLLLCLITLGLVSIGLSLPQLLPTAQFAELSNRQPLSYDRAGNGYRLGDLWELLSPQGLFQRGYFVGIAPIVLLLTAAVRQHAQRSFWLVVAMVGVLQAMGKYGPVYPLVYHILPGYALFEDQERAALLWAFAAAVLAAIGWTTVWRSGSPHTHERWIAPVALAFAIGVAATIALRVQPVSVANPASVIDPAIAVAVVLGLTVGTLALFQAIGRWRAPYPWAAAAAILLVVGPLYGANAGNDRASSPPSPGPDVVAALHFLEQQPGIFRVWQLQDIVPGDLGTIDHLFFAHGDSPIYLRTIRTLLETHLQYRIAQLFDVEYLVGNTANGGPGVKEVFRAGRVRVFHRLYGLPRAWAVRNVRVAATDATDLDLTLHVPQPGATVVLRRPPTMPIVGPSLPRDQHETWLRNEPTREEIRVSVTDNAMLVISQPKYPGWSATLDGKPVRLFSADYAFEAVELPAGVHTLLLRYDPPMLILGAVWGAVLLIAAAVTLAADARTRTPGHR